MMTSTAPLILPYHGIEPQFAGPLAHAGFGAAVLGRASLGANAWLGPLSVIRADGQYVKLGHDFHLGARSTVHIAHETLACNVGDRVSVGANSCVHACTVGNDVVIGDNVVILDGAVVEDNVILESGSIVFPGKHIAGGHVYAGAPAKQTRALAPGEIAERRNAILRERGQDKGTPFAPFVPTADIDPSVFIASTVQVRGRLRMAAKSSMWFSNDLDAGDAMISIGVNTNVQDNTVIRCTTGLGVTIGRDTTVGHNVLLHDCVIGNETLIGIGSTVETGTVVQDHVLLAAGARTEPGQVLESGWLYGRTPARKIAPLERDRQKKILFIITTYCQYAQDFKAADQVLARAS